MVRLEASDRGFVVHLDEIVDLVSPDVLRRGAERLGEAGGRGRRLLTLGREVELDPSAGAVAGEEPALGVKAHLPARGQVAVLPEDVRAREGRVTAERDLQPSA